MDNRLNDVKKSVFLIYTLNEKKELISIGTGFFVSLPPQNSQNEKKIFFVTAKHVLMDSTGNYYSEFYVRLNTKDGSREIPFNNTRIYTHSDPDVDIAVFPFLLDKVNFDFLCIPLSLITNPQMFQDYRISEGVNVFFTGMFAPHLGKTRNQPILRFGKIALIPEEKIEWKEDNKTPILVDLYLVDCQSFGGNSGAPVFFQFDEPLDESEKFQFNIKIFLAGIMKGYFNSAQTIVTETTSFILNENSGIAAVTPADKLLDILFSDELSQQLK